LRRIWASFGPASKVSGSNPEIYVGRYRLYDYE
jgi:hypothetical protein